MNYEIENSSRDNAIVIAIETANGRDDWHLSGEAYILSPGEARAIELQQGRRRIAVYELPGA